MIAVKNLYYLLLYAWNTFDEGRMAAVDAEPDTDLLNLMAAVLTRGVDHLLRRGPDRGAEFRAGAVHWPVLGLLVQRVEGESRVHGPLFVRGLVAAGPRRHSGHR